MMARNDGLLYIKLMGSNMSQLPLKNPVISCREYFTEVINEGMEKTKFYPSQLARFYLIEIMEQFLSTENLFEKKEKNSDNEENLSTGTLAEMLLVATNQKQGIRINLLKKLGDTSLYISGFLGDSLKYKIVDVDYYADIGCVAYQRLSKAIKDNSFQELYMEFATEFIKFMDLLTFFSHKSNLQNNTDLLRLYDKYIKTGSRLAKEVLETKGLISDDDVINKKNIKDFDQ